MFTLTIHNDEPIKAGPLTFEKAVPGHATALDAWLEASEHCKAAFDSDLIDRLDQTGTQVVSRGRDGEPGTTYTYTVREDA